MNICACTGPNPNMFSATNVGGTTLWFCPLDLGYVTNPAVLAQLPLPVVQPAPPPIIAFEAAVAAWVSSSKPTPNAQAAPVAVVKK